MLIKPRPLKQRFSSLVPGETFYYGPDLYIKIHLTFSTANVLNLVTAQLGYITSECEIDKVEYQAVPVHGE